MSKILTDNIVPELKKKVQAIGANFQYDSDVGSSKALYYEKSGLVIHIQGYFALNASSGSTELKITANPTGRYGTVIGLTGSLENPVNIAPGIARARGSNLEVRFTTAVTWVIVNMTYIAAS